jgi:spermidine/putrescine transport system permease protein
MNYAKKQKLKKIIGNSYLYLIVAILYLPLFMIMIYSFSSGGNFTNFSFSMANFRELFDGSSSAMLDALWNTLYIALGASTLATALGTLGAIGIYNMKKKASRLMMNMSQVPIFNADVVTALAVMLFFLAIGLPKGIISITLAHAVVSTPFVMLSVLPRLKQMNVSLYEAALDLGATPAQAIRKIMLPELLPGMIAGFFIAFTLSLDDFVIANYNSGDIETLSTFIESQVLGKAGMSGAVKPLFTFMILFVFGLMLLYNFLRSRDRKKVADGERK